MSHATEPRTESAATEIAPHARAFAERARKLEALPLSELAARVAEGLAGLRARFGLEERAHDPLAALMAALPRTELARRASDVETELARRASDVEAELARRAGDVEAAIVRRARDADAELSRRLADAEAELAAARAAVVERERAAADVERRSESLKEALRERSADLAQAIARADAAERARAGAAPTVPEREAERESEREPGREIERRIERQIEPGAPSALELPRAVALAREQQAENVLALAQLDRTALFQSLDAAAQELDLSRRQSRELLAELDARVPPPAVERARAQVEIDALLGDLAEREAALDSTRRDLAWRAREMDAMHAELQSARYRLLARAIVDRAERWVKPGRTEERP